ncbi:hypothetical protein BDK51DRAFT_38594 [Blyttiomyces helicus]|uniref:Uncharacterized protein n=1 Tax=Blyttiomyces helicus TaxID=388810 RepID=A0A4P9W663_9FUNG|nr:hypothetical protein BDK51DRAFT_38594 [Blyttiomyces helicus]|eukprot:RKO87939.1 hypothetical protein BDK51DRAFT_38594 [Blyttiomyces helicus]
MAAARTPVLELPQKRLQSLGAFYFSASAQGRKAAQDILGEEGMGDLCACSRTFQPPPLFDYRHVHAAMDAASLRAQTDFITECEFTVARCATELNLSTQMLELMLSRNPKVEAVAAGLFECERKLRKAHYVIKEAKKENGKMADAHAELTQRNEKVKIMGERRKRRNGDQAAGGEARREGLIKITGEDNILR